VRQKRDPRRASETLEFCSTALRGDSAIAERNVTEGAQYSARFVQLIAHFAAQLRVNGIGMSKNERTMAGLNVADWATDFSNNFRPPVKFRKPRPVVADRAPRDKNRRHFTKAAPPSRPPVAAF
jgi:hypothetical protein